MNDSEYMAMSYLYALNFDPKRVKINKNNVGTPDFKCSNNRFVEIKKISICNQFEIQKTQIKCWLKLYRKGKRIFIMVLDDNVGDVFFFEISNLIKINYPYFSQKWYKWHDDPYDDLVRMSQFEFKNYE